MCTDWLCAPPALNVVNSGTGVGQQVAVDEAPAAEAAARAAAKPVGIRDVARLAGVSVASASMALNGQPGVSDLTRQRIAAAAEQLGYRANPQAQALRRGRTTAYGFVVRNLANPFFLDVMSGAEQVASESGATLLVLDSRYSVEREAEHLRNMAAQRFAGLVIAPVGAGSRSSSGSNCGRASGRGAERAVRGVNGLSLVVPDNAAAVELPMRRIAELGHRSAAFIAAPRRLMADADRLAHFRVQAGPAGAATVRGSFTADDAGRRPHHGCAVLSGSEPPTSIITNSDYTAHAIYKAVRELGLRIGPVVSVVGHDDLPTSELLDPPLATIRMDRQEMGRS